MRYADRLQERFPGLAPRADDLFLLEAHQVASLPERAPATALAAVVHADQRLHRFLVVRHPPIEPALSRLLAEHEPVGGDELAAFEHELV